MVDVIHIGDYKTGTSWLQTVGWPSQKHLYFAGDPVNSELDRLLRVLTHGEDQDFLDGNIIEKLQIESARLRRLSDGKKVVLSREAFSCQCAFNGSNALRTAARLKLTFPDAKIIYFIRRQTDFFLSLYSQYLKLGGTLTQKDFFYSTYFNRRMISRMKYSSVIKSYCDLFDQNNVLIQTYEEMRHDNEGVLKKLVNFVDVEFTDISLNYAQLVNPSLRHWQCILLRYINKFLRGNFNHKNISLAGKLLFIILPRGKKVQYLKASRAHDFGAKFASNKLHRIMKQFDWYLHNKISEVLSGVQIGPKLKIEQEIAADIESRVAKDNQLIEQSLDLKLKRWSYRL
jgi:hypothetical protein